ncbi:MULTISPECIES: WbuC family cupin fold metalloprotein [unclassified Pseudodesulfovibrio]|uniref:WbuC family cupin fold metalloprotein n=1 Tax=unclassified Pseudodesulfovibrio TaxID=2661612 RepID=UPI000FEBA714|nr:MULTISPECIES: WbuC family cupin fold metalloprotein [unclassified Pseudodesulfovibrio]MCJ2166209.1 WbuC family cupin fold metalloprotein [Pseudodesulfovibrio sp. S3-i]RWU02339.1 cupin fold metalloprotein, WbuC family [Pseudodesulfovibrio sp. S3]
MTEEKNYPMALDAPDTDVTCLTLTMVGELLTLSKQSPRKRMLRKLHKSHDAVAHRMFNALQPGTYLMPHRHMNPPKDETILVMAGSMLFIRFTDDGQIAEHILLQPGTENFGIDVAPHVYHTFVPLKPDTLVFECKSGPYSQDTDKDVPDWAPHEGTPEAEPYLLEMLKALAANANAAVEAAKAAESEGPDQ